MEMLKRSRKVRRLEGQRKVRGLSAVSTSSVTWLALMAICSTVMSAMLLLSCLEAPPVAPSSIFCGLKEMNAQVKGQIACPPHEDTASTNAPSDGQFSTQLLLVLSQFNNAKQLQGFWMDGSSRRRIAAGSMLHAEPN